jgi:hypothetical protein
MGRFPTGVPISGSPGDPTEVVKFTRSCRLRSKGGASGAKAHFVFSLTAGLKPRPSDSAIYEVASNHRSRIAAFLIDTLAIRIAPKSLGRSADVTSNRHSSGASASVPALIRRRAPAPKLPVEQSAGSRTLNSSTSSPSFTSSTSSSPLSFASQTTRLEDRYLLANLPCYSLLVTRVPPIGLRASAPAGSHGCGVVVFLSRNVSTTGAFPHKIHCMTGLMGPAEIAVRYVCKRSRRHQLKIGPVDPFEPRGFCSPESPIHANAEKGVKETPCAS